MCYTIQSSPLLVTEQVFCANRVFWVITNSIPRILILKYSFVKDNSTAKAEIDRLQIEFECCGNSGYEDWFDLQWISNDFLDMENSNVQRLFGLTLGWVQSI